MSQLGGVASLITLQTKSALNITPLSVYPQEKESLLAPGTNLKGTQLPCFTRTKVLSLLDLLVQKYTY
jgi:hypothetical protein